MKYKEQDWHLICGCNSYEHQVNFLYMEEILDDGKVNRDMFMNIHLVGGSFWHRLKTGLAYIFGHKSRFGAFDEFVLAKKHAQAFREVAEKLETMDNEV